MPEPPQIHVHLLPSLIPSGALQGGVAIVVDVLRATTVMVHALAAGCDAVVPCLEIDEARRVAADLPEGTALLGGERAGLPIEGFDLGNSPGDYTPATCRGKTLVMTTTNGTRAILACGEAERVLIAAFSNAVAAVKAADPRHGPRHVHVVCAGTDGRVSFEDTLLAGLLVASFKAYHGEPGNDGAEIARRCWFDARFGTGKPHPLDEILATGRGGRRVREIGLAADIAESARTDRFTLVAELRSDPTRIVAVT